MSMDDHQRGGHHKPIPFEDGFPNSYAICSAFFQQPEASTKNWASLDVLVTADDKTFWTVVATHPKLPQAVDQLVRSVDESHATASKQHRVPKQQEKQLIQFLVRLMTTVVHSSGGAKFTTSSVAIRMSHVIPSSLLLPISLMLLRAGGPVASTSLTAFLMVSPIALTHFTSVTAMWYDSVTQIATKCVHEAKRGRFQRRGGDVMPLIERTYRLTKHVWALYNAAPFLVDYSDIRRVLVGLRIVTDIISPQLQHFIMVSDELAARRPQLTKANAMILNAAIGAASLATMFFTFSNDVAVTSPSGRSSAAAASPKKKDAPKSCIGETAMRSFEESCSAYLLQFCPGVPAALVERNKNLREIFHAIEKPPTHEEGSSNTSSAPGVRLAALLEWANGPIPNSNDFVDGSVEGQERLGLCLVMELVHQGYSIEKLVLLGFLDHKEAATWGGGSSQFKPSTGRPSPPTHAPKSSALSAPAHNSQDHEFERVSTGDPAVDMILSVLPHFTPTLAANALGYYNGDVELLINDALSGNLPPHLEAELPLHEDDNAAHGPSAAAAFGVPEDEEYDHSASAAFQAPAVDAAPHGDMERFVSSHYIDETDEAAYDDGDGGNMLTTVDGHALSDTLYLDEGFREHTFEFLYDDERDDANDGEAHVWGAVGANDDSSEDDEMRDLVPLNNPAPAASSGGPGPHSGHHDGRGRGGKFGSRQQPASERGRGRGSGKAAGGAAAPGGDEGRAPSYKKVKERKSGGGGSKSALQRSLKRAGFE
jgi:hypothetical protein